MNMVMEPLIFTLMVLLLGSCTTAWNFTISRNSTNKLSKSVVDSIDQFNISKCNNSNLCTTFGGQKLQDKCQCVCSQEKSTFGFYNNRWGCTKNSIVQQHSGCQYILERPSGISNRDDHPLFTLPVLGSHNDNNYVKNIPTNKSCKVIAANATFLQCDGTWGRLTESSVTSKLSFQDQRRGMVFIGPYQTSSPVVPSLNGRVIRIPIKCEGQTWHPSQCVTFKIKGQLSCTCISGTTKESPPLVPVESTKRSPTTTSGIRNVVKKAKGEDSTPDVPVIAGSVVGGVIFVIIIVVIITLVICWRRRKDIEAKNKNGRTQENLAYEQGPDPSMTFTRPKSFRPLPEPPLQSPYQTFQREPSINIQNPNGQNSGSRDHDNYNHCNGEPLYGEIDDTYSRLNHQLLQPTRSMSDEFKFANGPSSDFFPEVPTMSTLLSSDRSESGLRSLKEYDVVGGQIKNSLPRGNSLRSAGGGNSLGRHSNSPYDIPETIIRSSSKERPRSDSQDNVTAPSNAIAPSNASYQPHQRETFKREDYETVWNVDNDDNDDDFDDDLVARIDLS